MIVPVVTVWFHMIDFDNWTFNILMDIGTNCRKQGKHISIIFFLSSESTKMTEKCKAYAVDHNI